MKIARNGESCPDFLKMSQYYWINFSVIPEDRCLDTETFKSNLQKKKGEGTKKKVFSEH